MIRYRLVFYGDLLPDVTPEECLEQLSTIFGHSVERMRPFLFADRPAVIKTVRHYETAERFVDAFARAGAVLHIEESRE
jgi:hypothetical protein